MPGPSEAATRKDLIDPALLKAGWDVNDPYQVGLEIPLGQPDLAGLASLQATLNTIQQAEGIPNKPLPAGITDYILKRSNGEILAVVEAKRTSIDPRLAQAQAEFYVTQIEKRQSFRPFAFMTNGYDIYFLDAGQANKRLVAGFFTAEDLENLLWLRQNRLSLASTPINPTITDRSYQQEAVRRVSEAFEHGQRKTLLIMATGTGKTRTVMSIVDVFLRANQARKILFVADRDPLVTQAEKEGFKVFLPNEPLARIHSWDIQTTSRLYVSTLQTLSVAYHHFSPGFFDLIIFDEVHRSIFNKWSEVLSYFDARLIGLTATPASFIDRNTFLAFDCAGGIPTYLYTYEEAVKEGYLVDFHLYKARTGFQRKGIRGADLSEEQRNALIENGIDPDEIAYDGSDLEKKVTNRDTIRKQWEEFWEVAHSDRSGQLPGKTIVFALTQDHALRLADAFEQMYPQHPGLAQVITYKSDHKDLLLANFKTQNFPVSP